CRHQQSPRSERKNTAPHPTRLATRRKLHDPATARMHIARYSNKKIARSIEREPIHTSYTGPSKRGSSRPGRRVLEDRVRSGVNGKQISSSIKDDTSRSNVHGKGCCSAIGRDFEDKVIGWISGEQISFAIKR